MVELESKINTLYFIGKECYFLSGKVYCVNVVLINIVVKGIFNFYNLLY